MTQNWKGIAKGLVIGVILAASATAMAAWSEPTSAPTGGNPEAPINVSNTSQTKGGNLVVNSNNQSANGLLIPFGKLVVGNVTPTAALKVHIVGKTGSDQFCNTAGTKCFTVDQLCTKVANLCQ